ncbi:hypothetical protein SOVF_107130 isoform A, partial [Spinacia oleracea]
GESRFVYFIGDALSSGFFMISSSNLSLAGTGTKVGVYTPRVARAVTSPIAGAVPLLHRVAASPPRRRSFSSTVSQLLLHGVAAPPPRRRSCSSTISTLSVIEVRNGLTFLDLIVMQIENLNIVWIQSASSSDEHIQHA